MNKNMRKQLENFLGRPTDNFQTIVDMENPGSPDEQEVCDRETGICYTIKSRDGLIERVDNSRRVNRKVQVEAPSGQVKQLLNG
jgi:hypothetical protein